jgi:hypothetical protein
MGQAIMSQATFNALINPGPTQLAQPADSPPAPAAPGAGAAETVILIDNSYVGRILGDSQSDDPRAPPGAPPLAHPLANMSSVMIGIEISALMSKLSSAQADAERNGLEVDDKIRQSDLKASNEKIDQARQKIQAAAHKTKEANGWATAAKVLTGVAAVCLTLATGGAATPFTLAIIGYTVLDTTMTVVDTICQAEGVHQRLDLNDLMGEGMTKLAEACGADKDTAEKIGEWGPIALQATIAVVSIGVAGFNAYSALKGAAGVAAGAVEGGVEMAEVGAQAASSAAEAGAEVGGSAVDAGAEAGGSATEAGAEAVGQAAEDAAETAADQSQGWLASKIGATGIKAVKISGIVSQFMGGAAQATSGGVSLSSADATQQADQANAEKMKWEAAKEIMDKMIQTILARLQGIAMQLSEGVKTATDIVAKADQTSSVIIQNTV